MKTYNTNIVDEIIANDKEIISNQKEIIRNLNTIIDCLCMENLKLRERLNSNKESD